jgi:AraC-like DNA-binding protein
MICKDFLPAPELREFIQCYHLRHFVFSSQDHPIVKPYAPRPEHTLAFYPHGFESVYLPPSDKLIKRPASALIGQPAERTDRYLGGAEFLVFLVNFEPGALFRLTGLPSWELADTFIDAESIFLSAITLVNERLNSATNYREMIGIVDRFLYSLVKKVKKDSHPLDQVTRHLISNPENTRIVSLAESSFLSSRQFERRFKERTGISPKLFTQIARLTKALKIKYNAPGLDWLSVALQCGYNDYQHLAKDYQKLAGISPTGYLLEESAAPERQFGFRDSSL